MTTSQYRDRLTAVVTELATAAGEALINGASQSFDSYREQVGELRGLRKAGMAITRVYADMFDLQETEEKVSRGIY